MSPTSHGELRYGFRAWLRRTLTFPVTLLSLVCTFVGLGIAEGLTNKRIAGEVFMSVGGALAALLMIDLLMIIHEEWNAWPWIFDRLRAWRRHEVGARRPTKFYATMYYPVHLFDEYIGLALSFALLAMGPWVLDQTSDKSRFYSGFDVMTDRNVWTTWIKFASTSFLVGTGTGFASFVPIHWATFLIYLFNGTVLFLFVTVVLNIVLGWFFEKDHDELFDTHAHGELYQQQQQQQQQQTPPRQSYYDQQYAAHQDDLSHAPPQQSVMQFFSNDDHTPTWHAYGGNFGLD